MTMTKSEVVALDKITTEIIDLTNKSDITTEEFTELVDCSIRKAYLIGSESQQQKKSFFCIECGETFESDEGDDKCPSCSINGRLVINAKAIAGVAHSQQLAIRLGEPMNGDDIDDFVKVFKMELRKLNGDIAS